MTALISIYRYNDRRHINNGESVQYCLILIPCFKTVQWFFNLISLWSCTSESYTSYNMQRYLLMLLVAAETVSRTCIACFFYLIANVSKKKLTGVSSCFCRDGASYASISIHFKRLTAPNSLGLLTSATVRILSLTGQLARYTSISG